MRAIFDGGMKWAGRCLWALLGLWAVLAIWYCSPLSKWVNLAIGIAITGAFAASFGKLVWPEGRVSKRRRQVLAAFAVGGVALWYFGFVHPSLSIKWATDHAHMPRVEVDGRIVRVQNARNFTWRTRTDFDATFYDRTYDADKIETMYYVVAPMPTVDAIAHVMVCFAFSDGQAVTISVEGRRPQGVEYGLLPSLFRQFQLIYVIGDERDVIGVRGAVWKIPVRMYPARTTPERMRAIFLDMARRAHELEEKPEFYNLIFNNCMNNITYHLRRLGGRPLPSDLAVLLTGLSDRVAYRLGYIKTDLPFELARRAFRVDLWMQQTSLDETFSARLRETLVRQENELRLSPSSTTPAPHGQR